MNYIIIDYSEFQLKSVQYIYVNIYIYAYDTYISYTYICDIYNLH